MELSLRLCLIIPTLCCRWRILKTGVRLQSAQAVDKVWLTCCALHNWLLDGDGLDESWGSGENANDYLGHLGLHDAEDALRFVPADRATPSGGALAFDMSGMGPGGDRGFRGPGLSSPAAAATTPEAAGGGAGAGAAGTSSMPISVRSLSLQAFRKKLIAHFAILWSQHKVTWPTRNKGAPPAD